MKTFDNELVVHRNEDFTLDKTIQNKDGSPYIISSELINPYFLITISTTNYFQQKRYIANYWLDISSYPRFVSTQCIDLHTLKSDENGTNVAYSDFSEVSGPTVEGYINGTFVIYEPGDAVFYVVKDGVKTYKYYDKAANEWKDYKCKLIKTFLSTDTREWIEQTYTYSISLVSGDIMEDYLRSVCDSNHVNSKSMDLEELYENAKPFLPQDFSINKPLGTIDKFYVLLPPTKMSVLSSIQGGV